MSLVHIKGGLIKRKILLRGFPRYLLKAYKFIFLRFNVSGKTDRRTEQ